MKKQRKLVRRAFTIWDDQDDRLGKLASAFPDMDKSKILRYLLAGSLSSLEKDTIMRAVLGGHVSTWEEREKGRLEKFWQDAGIDPDNPPDF